MAKALGFGLRGRQREGKLPSSPFERPSTAHFLSGPLERCKGACAALGATLVMCAHSRRNAPSRLPTYSTQQ